MDVVVLIIAIAVAWTIVAIGLALLVGRVIQRRDKSEGQDQDAGADRSTLKPLAGAPLASDQRTLPHAA